ncbi:hypothetical protein HN51_058698 [Arachis hypogaea]
MADAYSANMFLVSWAQLSQPTKPTILTHQPCFRSSRLSPQRPPSINPSIDRVYHPEPNTKPDVGPVICLLYYITVEQLNHIQTLATSNSAKPTKLESISTFLWKLVASGAISSETGYGKLCKI